MSRDTWDGTLWLIGIWVVLYGGFATSDSVYQSVAPHTATIIIFFLWVGYKFGFETGKDKGRKEELDRLYKSSRKND